VTIQLNKDAQEHVPSGTPIQLTTNWVADPEEHVADYLVVAALNGTLDGQPLPDLNDYRGQIEPYQGGGYISQRLYPKSI